MPRQAYGLVYPSRQVELNRPGHDPAATAFRASLRLTSLPAYVTDTLSEARQILPLVLFSPRIKVIADETIAF